MYFLRIVRSLEMINSAKAIVPPILSCLLRCRLWSGFSMIILIVFSVTLESVSPPMQASDAEAMIGKPDSMAQASIPPLHCSSVW